MSTEWEAKMAQRARWLRGLRTLQFRYFSSRRHYRHGESVSNRITGVELNDEILSSACYQHGQLSLPCQPFVFPQFSPRWNREISGCANLVCRGLWQSCGGFLWIGFDKSADKSTMLMDISAGIRFLWFQFWAQFHWMADENCSRDTSKGNRRHFKITWVNLRLRE